MAHDQVKVKILKKNLNKDKIITALFQHLNKQT